LTKNYDSGYQLELLIKDAKIAKETIASTGFDSKLPDLAISYLQDAMNICKPGADHTECLKGWEKRAGIELNKTELKNESTANGSI
jgi:3-hydroxyisobutyrate dehydrogenase-like beta-hydroxyacid dehydrogenase